MTNGKREEQMAEFENPKRRRIYGKKERGGDMGQTLIG